MAVYTVVSPDEARALLARLGLGELRALQGIAAGIENTNYFVDTDRGRYVLTIFERLAGEPLAYDLALMRHLAGRGLPVPDPQPRAQGGLGFELHGKPAALLTRLPGSHRMAPDLHHVEQLGQVLARMHRAGADFGRTQPNPRGLAWCEATAAELRGIVGDDASTLMAQELVFQRAVAASVDHAQLARGPVHADLFRDNVLFDGLPGHEKLTGLLDFFFAGEDAFAFDIAVCLNDWCCDLDSGRLDEMRAAALVAAYERERPLVAAELRLMPALLRAAALRFWLSRLHDLHRPRAAALLQPHDPAPFERMLRERIAQPWHPPR
ncbi:MAG: homoserine kinase [Burkholderiales bacterium]|nr:homoserine kinase [Burkholderiales bacterium]